MKYPLTTLAVLCYQALLLANNPNCEGQRYFNTIFEDVSVTRDVSYGKNTTVGGHEMNLVMDIYQPENDDLAKRPLIVFAHGGGFVGGDKSDIARLGRAYAQHGFVVASISYRLHDVENQQLLGQSIANAFHDMKAAVRFLREDSATSDRFRIDPEFIVAAGGSAGAIMANMVSYMDTSDVISPMIEFLLNQDGGFEGLSRDNLEYSSEVHATLNLCGSIFSLDWINQDDPPLYSFHDELDQTVPCGFNPEISAIMSGSCSMHERANELGIINQFYFNEGNEAHCDWSHERLVEETTQFLANLYCK